jgi:hypothetical protein
MSSPPAGYSGKPTAAKLGLKPGQRLRLCGEAVDYEALVGPLPEGLLPAPDGPFDLAHLFVRSRAALEAALPPLLADLADKGMIWVSWPKKTRGQQSAITEDDIRAVALPIGLVDVKVCAVDLVWSGLKLLRRKVSV